MRGAEAADGGVAQRLHRLRHAARERLQTHRARRGKRQRHHRGIHRLGIVGFHLRKQPLRAQVIQHARHDRGNALTPSGLGRLGSLVEMGRQLGALLGQLLGPFGFQVEREQPMAVVARGSKHLPAGHVLERSRHAARDAHLRRVHRARHVGALERRAERAQQKHRLVGRALRLLERERGQTRRVQGRLAHHLVHQLGERALDLVGAPRRRRAHALAFEQLEAFLDGLASAANGNVAHLAHLPVCRGLVRWGLARRGFSRRGFARRSPICRHLARQTLAQRDFAHRRLVHRSSICRLFA